MSDASRNYELPKNIDHYLSILSKLYAQDGKRQLQAILVNSRMRIREAWSSDGWDGGTDGHALFLILPEPLFLSSIGEKEDIGNQIKEDINKLHNVRNEFIEAVFLEMEAAEDHDWRKESGLLINGRRDVSPEATKRIWKEDGFRVFLSHKSEFRKEAAAIKDRLRLFGIAAFVAHEDIHPTRAWQDEIECALATMDGFVALMTEDFHDSHWTDQEVGYAVARGAPIIAVRLGTDPYGFIGRFQALSGTWQEAAEGIIGLLMTHERLFGTYVTLLRSCQSWDYGNALANVLPSIGTLSSSQIDALISVYNENGKLRGSFGFNGEKPIVYGPGLVPCLNRLGNRKFGYSTAGFIERVT